MSGSEDLPSSPTGAHINTIEKPAGSYNSLIDAVRRRAPEPLKCSLGCGGKNCKYCNPQGWTDDVMAVKGLFSHWVTEDILATSRPTSDAIKKYDIIEQFHRNGIKSIINLQTAGEHSSCGFGLHESGFSYNPQEFMDNDVFFYNFGWDDYGVRSLTFLLDMVKVMAFALKQGKVAVHCHAGLGRTGVLIASYLIYEQRMDGDNAVHFVRNKRPKSIQTSIQVECCQQFAQFLVPLRLVFSSCDPRAFPFTLTQYLNRQKHILHGYEARDLKYIPKIIYIICNRMLILAGGSSCNRKDDDIEVMKQMSPRAFYDLRDPEDEEKPNHKKGSNFKRSSSAECVPNMGNLSLHANISLPRMLQNGRVSPNVLSKSLQKSDDESSLDRTSSSKSSGSRKKSRKKLFHTYERTPFFQKRTSVLLCKDGVRVPSIECDDAELVARALAYDTRKPRENLSPEQEMAFKEVKDRVESLQNNLNASNSAWNILATEEDPLVLSTLMWSWLHHLQEPVLNSNDYRTLLDENEHLLDCLKGLSKDVRFTLDYMLLMVAKFPMIPHKVEEAVLGRLVEAVSFFTFKKDYVKLLYSVEEALAAKKALRKWFAVYVAQKREKLHKDLNLNETQYSHVSNGTTSSKDDGSTESVKERKSSGRNAHRSKMYSKIKGEL